MHRAPGSQEPAVRSVEGAQAGGRWFAVRSTPLRARRRPFRRSIRSRRPAGSLEEMEATHTRLEGRTQPVRHTLRGPCPLLNNNPAYTGLADTPLETYIPNGHERIFKITRLFLCTGRIV